MAKSMDSISKTPAAGATGEGSDKAVIETVPASKPAETPAPAKPEEKPVEAAPAKPEATPAPAADPSANPDVTMSVPGTPAAGSEDSYDALFPEPTAIIERPPQWIWWLVLLVASVVLALVGYKLVSGKLDGWIATSHKATPSPTASASSTPTATPTASTSPTPTPASTATPTATPTASPSTVTKSSISLRVLNGTTKTGAAATTKTTLEKAGFTVKSTGNAKTQNYATTYVYYKTGKSAEAEEVRDALPGKSITLQESTTLTAPDDVLVVIGLK